MTTSKLYRYLGRNGILTTKILLDGINHISMVMIKADEGKILTDGNQVCYSIIVEETEVSNWREVADNTDK